MNEKIEKMKRLAAQESPKLSRREIADLVGCSACYVTKCLGPNKRYKPRQPKVVNDQVS